MKIVVMKIIRALSYNIYRYLLVHHYVRNRKLFSSFSQFAISLASSPCAVQDSIDTSTFFVHCTMIRGLNKMCGHNKGFLLEPYITASCLNVTCHPVSTKAPASSQNLPRLPVPKLQDTLNKYLKSVKPFLNDEEYRCTTQVVKEFLNGSGQKLQDLLNAKAQDRTNWLEDWWLSTAYLGYRDPVVVFSSPGLVYPFQRFESQLHQLKYAARTLNAALDYKSLIDCDKIPVEKMGKNPLDMSQYKKIFGTCRVPCAKQDKLSYNDSKYVTVIHNNHIFHVDLWGEDNLRLSEDQIVQQLQTVIASSLTPAPYPVGILTSENRDTWAKAYDILVKDSTNRESLMDIERSLAVLCLDKASGLWNCPDKGSQQSLAGAQTIHGCGSNSNGANRWFDKTIQFIVGADGVTGLTYEHSPAEGQPIAVMTNYIVDYIEQARTSTESSSSAKPPKLLNFVVNKEVGEMMNTAASNLDKLANNLELNCFTYDKYGKNFIKSQKLSPDSYLQMAMQLAFYRLYSKPGAHYESAATRMYAGGRTETIRSCSEESIAFAKTMLDSCCSPKDKVQSLKNAIQAHKDYTVQALQGLGVDRHLLGLKLAALENGIAVPKLYSDPSFVRSAHMRLSTSQVATKCDGFMCYGPLVPDGYATCYNPRDEDVNFALAAFVDNPETSCGLYRGALEKSLQDMQDVLLLTTPSKL